MMTTTDYLKTVFQLFLCFLSERGVGELVVRCRREPDGAAAAVEFARLLDAGADELLALVRREGDEEDRVKYLNVFLWKQARGLVARDLRAVHAFGEAYYNWLAHRQMVSNGYDWRGGTEVCARGEAGASTYPAEIEAHMRAFEASPDAQDHSHLAMLLNVAGPDIARHELLPRAYNFARHLVTRFDADESLRWLNPSAFTLLLYDISYPPEESWPVYRRLARMEHNLSVFNYPAWLVGLRMYGQPARDELRRADVPGGFGLLEALAEL
jgi:hypothetical protein